MQKDWGAWAPSPAVFGASPNTFSVNPRLRAQIWFWHDLARFSARLSVRFAGSGGMAKGLFQAEMRRMGAVQGF